MEIKGNSKLHSKHDPAYHIMNNPGESFPWHDIPILKSLFTGTLSHLQSTAIGQQKKGTKVQSKGKSPM